MSCQVYYYSGAYHPTLKREMNCDQLFTVYHEKNLIIDTIKYKREHPEYTAKIMCDSGAFTHYQNSKKKGIVLTDEDMYAYTDTYLEFLNEWGDGLECFVGVDSVPNPDDVDQSFAEKTWKNYLYMWEKLKPELRHKLIPVFHYGEDWKWLKKYLEHVHPDGSKVAYMGLAISLEGTKKVRIAWGQDAMKIISESSNPEIKTHAFGVGVRSVLEHIDVYSTDATSWVKRAAYGMVAIEDKTIYISDVQREKLCGNYYGERSLGFQKAVEDIIRERGYLVNPLEANYRVTDVNQIEFTIDETDYVVRKDNDQTILLIHGNAVDEFKLDKVELMDTDEDEVVDGFKGTWTFGEHHLTFDGKDKVTYDPGNVLSTNCYARARFNIEDTEIWMERIRNMKPIVPKTKVELW